MNSNQSVATPQIFVDEVARLFNIMFAYDMAASRENAKCIGYFIEADNSLKMDWPLGDWLWLNPPFKRLGLWVDKCIEQKARGCKIVSIWPLSGDLNQIDVWVNCDVSIIHGRIWPEVRGVMLCRWDAKLPPAIRGLRWDKKNLVHSWGARA